ncbi:MAG: hypothetical protein AB1384_06790 [Actinomycetota bacterium]
MEENEEGTAEKPAARAGNTVKWAFVVGLVAAAAVIGFFAIFRGHAAEDTVRKALQAVEEGDADGFVTYLDPEGQLGKMWEGNEQGARDAALSLLESYRFEFSSLKFSTRAQGENAEVELEGGRVTVYNRDGGGPPAAFFDLKDSGLVFYVEKKDGRWLIGGVNYDLEELLSGGADLLPL